MSDVDGSVPALPAAPTNSWITASGLLEHWCERPIDVVPVDLDGVLFEAWSELVAAVEQRFESNDGSLTATDLEWIEATRDRIPDSFLWAHAIAWGLDVATWHAFPLLWHESIGQPAVHRLNVGELYPVGDWLPTPPVGMRRSVRPSAENTRRNELPHVRRWDAWTEEGGSPVSVEFHFDSAPEVRACAEAGVAASAHSNGTNSEFDVPGTTSLFPVAPLPEDQAARITRLLDACGPRDVGLFVGGEVSLTADVIEQLQAWIDTSWTAPPLVVAGTIHTTSDEDPVNLAVALRQRRSPLIHRKVVPFEMSTSPSKPPVREGIAPGPRLLKVWVGGWARFAMLICRDVLDPSLRVAVGRAGVNLLAVPTYSDETSSYAVHVAAISLGTQGRVVLANNPTSFHDSVVNPIAVFGEPLRDRSSVPFRLDEEHPGTGRGVCFNELGVALEWFEDV